MTEAPFRRLLVANRGEIAVRIMRTCAELGIESVAVYSDADAGALHVRLADRAERIGPAAAAQSYLSVEALIAAARRTAVDAIHPGYGFLSEQPALARAAESAGIAFVGPPPATLEELGDKLAARRAAASAGAPVVPGLTVALGDEGGAGGALEEVGYPLLLKAAAGGGGRGMRRVDTPGALSAALAAARREAAAAFGDPTLYAERLLEGARHVEVQVLGDRYGRLACLAERDCSIQRRHQKLVEESPGPSVSETTRAALFDSARRVIGAVPFHGAATVEFLVDRAGNHYFLEVNPRLQVEHGVTELVTGLDLVAWQILLTAGEHLPDSVTDPTPQGHAIEVRVYAEDPYDDFRPRLGRITAWEMPSGPGVRVDAGVERGTDLPSEYDALLAKVLVHAGDRPAAVARLRRALDEALVGGVQTGLGFHRWLVDQPAFVAGAYDTGFVAQRWGDHGPELTDEERALAALAAISARSSRPPAGSAAEATAPPGGARPELAAWAREGRREGLRRG